MAEARKAAQSARALAAAGTNPITHRKAEKTQGQHAAEHTFGVVARKVLGKAKLRGRADSTLTKKNWILRNFSSGFLATPVIKIDLPAMKRQLQTYADVGTGEIPVRMQALIIEVFRRAAQDGLISYNPAHDLKDIVERKAPKHHPAVTKPAELSELLQKIDDYAERNVISGSALKLMALLYQRPGELRQAKWDEFDLKACQWTIPKERMKMRRPHWVPLPRQAITILKALQDISGPHGYVFPAISRKIAPISENTLNHALRRMGVERHEHSSHGFRATASTLLNGSGKFSPDMIELSLSHKDPDKVRSAYARGDFANERIKMAQWWAEYLDRLRGQRSNVLAMKR